MAHILVIDDEAPVRTTLRKMLEIGGHRVSEAADGNEGLEMFAAAGADLVISDIIMPEKEGVETIIALRRQYPEVRIIAISGGGRKANFDFLDFAKRLGADQVLRKPFRKEQLLEAVRACLGGGD
jgi:CheY-like chemotaxis protein